MVTCFVSSARFFTYVFSFKFSPQLCMVNLSHHFEEKKTKAKKVSLSETIFTMYNPWETLIPWIEIANLRIFLPVLVSFHLLIVSGGWDWVQGLMCAILLSYISSPKSGLLDFSHNYSCWSLMSYLVYVQDGCFKWCIFHILFHISSVGTLWHGFYHPSYRWESEVC